jgi:hypothetical protein
MADCPDLLWCNLLDAGCGANCLYQGYYVTPAPADWSVLKAGTYLMSDNGMYVAVYQSNGELAVSYKALFSGLQLG